MPAVPWLIPGGDVHLEEPADAPSSGTILLGLFLTGLTALLVVAAIRSASKSPMASRPGHHRPTSSVSEKLSITEPQALAHEQRLYQRFPGHLPPAMDDGLRQADSDNSYLKKGDSKGLPAHDTTSSRAVEAELVPGESPTESHHPAQRLISAAPRFMMPRPPPPPPLTPPELSSSIFNMDHRKYSYAAASPEMGAFFDQPNPDYSSDTAASQTTATAPAPSPSTPRRRSYTKSVPIGVPGLTPSVSLTSEGSDVLSSSFPPTIPFLPGPPPGHDAGFVDSPQEMEVQGEIISVLDDAGTGWKRHTRVYGGGVCLACAASGSEGHGGFYGVNVRPEDRR